MKKYKSGLSDSLQQANPKTPIVKTSEEPDKAEQKKPPSRQGKVGMTFYVEASTKKKFSILAIESDCTQQALFDEALEDLFIKLNVE